MFDFIYKLRFFFLPYIKILHLEYTIYIHNFESINFSIHIHQHFLPLWIYPKVRESFFSHHPI